MPLNKLFMFRTVGISIDQAAKLLKIPQPTHIKMDVDGLEHHIFASGASVLKRVSELSIEVNENFVEQVIKVKRYCIEAGLVFKQKMHSVMFDDHVRFGNTYNQIWHRTTFR